MHTVFEKIVFRESTSKGCDSFFLYKRHLVKCVALYRAWSVFFDALYYPLFLIFIFLRLLFKICFLLFSLKSIGQKLIVFLEELFYSFFNFWIVYFRLKKLLRYIVKGLNSNLFISKVYLYLKRFFFFVVKFRYEGALTVNAIDFKFLSEFKLYILERFFSQSIFYYFSKYLNFMFYPVQIKLDYKIISSQGFTASLLFFFFVRNLKSRKPINKIVNLVLSDLKKKNDLLGFRILTSGRFTRKERAYYKWISLNRVPLSMYNSIVDYYAGVFKSRFGICSLRIWLFKKL